LLQRTSSIRLRADVDLNVAGPASALAATGSVKLRNSRLMQSIDLLAWMQRGQSIGTGQRGFALPSMGPESMTIDVDVETIDPLRIYSNVAQGMEGTDSNVMEMLQELLPKRKKRRRVHLHEARRILIDEELKKLVDMDDVVTEALDRVENHGILFIDEIDKIAGERGTVGPDVSREGVQRDLLPIVEGSTVQTRSFSKPNRRSCQRRTCNRGFGGPSRIVALILRGGSIRSLKPRWTTYLRLPKRLRSAIRFSTSVSAGSSRRCRKYNAWS
jgi:hypothetical protein